MAILSVSPTRMELSRLKGQLQLSQRGHKLLKDKQDELMRQFIDIVRETEAFRTQMEERYRDIRRRAVMARAAYSDSAVEENSLTQDKPPTLRVQTKNQMGVQIPEMTFSPDPQPDPVALSLSPDLVAAKAEMLALFPMLCRLAQMEKSCTILSAEIEKTRRRVNALEYMTIPQLQETIRFIRMRLEDAERDRITRLIKMQDFDQIAGS